MANLPPMDDDQLERYLRGTAVFNEEAHIREVTGRQLAGTLARIMKPRLVDVRVLVGWRRMFNPDIREVCWQLYSGEWLMPNGSVFELVGSNFVEVRVPDALASHQLVSSAHMTVFTRGSGRTDIDIRW